MLQAHDPCLHFYLVEQTDLFKVQPLLFCVGTLLEMASSIPTASTKGFRNASSYDRHRPSYPPEAVDRFLKHLQVHGVKQARLVDLAAGTGKFTELLVGRDEEFEILAVEPHNGTYRVFTGHLFLHHISRHQSKKRTASRMPFSISVHL